MRLITFLSKFTFICNIAFLLFVFFRWMEMQKHVKGSTDQIITVPFVENIIVVLGYFCAFSINLLMNVVYLILLVTGRIKGIATWLVFINFLFLLLQIFYFFFYN